MDWIFCRSVARKAGVALSLALGLAALPTTLMPLPALAQTETVARPDEQTIHDAYVYLLGRLLVIRQEQMDSKADGFAWNTIHYNPLGTADFVNPNFDVAYLEAWIATDDDSGVLLEVPEIQGRYYTAQILDEWGEVIANINERTFPSKPFGKFALVKPGSTVAIPPDAGRIELHSAKAKLLARVEIKGDPDGAVALQKQFKLSPVGAVTPVPAPDRPNFDNKTLIGVEAFDNVDAVLSSALDVSPVAATMQQKARFVAAYAASSPAARAEIDKALRDAIIPDFVQNSIAKSLEVRDGWAIGDRGGAYGSDYFQRTTANYAGIWANSTDEVVYFSLVSDGAGKRVDGSKSYGLHFPADSLPAKVVDGYWSVILVGVPDYRVVPNPLKRYNFNSNSKLTPEADGSLKIGIGPKPVAGVPEANWLPSPEGHPFSLTFRAYVPKAAVKEGKWTPPPLTELR
ncbi:hypothetical protein K32_46410 [Kaistia sp. 32K]|uniref:DUF1214 domain-containing protein n=1 Tax=Kaistia sp. 32K TaxID=2795690 RepID=UPI00193868AA|nr:DUF1214 domain-containing protein [Kaistia sp. 32K]BCP56024.1 hypothetical protein K32_46410 [Kaistia sp. 32K]